jgi:hypothetical protein
MDGWMGRQTDRQTFYDYIYSKPLAFMGVKFLRTAVNGKIIRHEFKIL